MTNLTMMQITVLVPTSRVHEVASWLEDNGAVSMMVKAHRNGAAEPATLKEEMTRALNRAYLKTAKRTTPQKKSGLNLLQIGDGQQKWLERQQGAFKLTDILDEWEGAGWKRTSIYGAVSRAVKRGVLKKTGPSSYVRAVRERQDG